MTSQVSISRLALSHIGAGTISSLTEQTPQAVQCSLHFDEARKAALRSSKWGFATRYENLALLSETYGKWQYAYAYPTDCLEARHIVQPVEGGRPIKFEVAVNRDLDQKIILTNQDQAQLEYTADVTNPVLFDPMFVEAFAYRLAASLAMPLTRDLKNYNAMWTIFNTLMSGAMTHDANEGIEEFSVHDRTPDWLEARS